MAEEAKKAEEGEVMVRMPLLAAFGATRALGGFGLGLLLANKFGSRARHKLGMVLLGGGIASTVPLVWQLRGRLHCREESAQQPA